MTETPAGPEVSGGKVRTPIGNAPLLPVMLLIGGAYLAWFGAHYWRDKQIKWPSDPLKSVLTGKGVPTPQPATTVRAELATVVGAASSTGGGAASTNFGGSTGSQIADDALKYEGTGYVWGGNADKPGNWDCSSFVSYVLGHDLHMPLPGGKWGDPGFPPNAHGPTTTTYRLFGTQINRAQVAAGDLIVWSDHIAIAVSATHAISAHSPSIGTKVSDIDAESASHPGGASYRRV